MLTQDSVNGQSFEAFIREYLLPVLNPGDVVVWDNLPVHKMETIKALVKSCGARIVLLPPYSPELNPIELLWSKLKQLVRGFAPKTKRAFNRALKHCLEKITVKDIRGWFKHCGYRAHYN